MKSSRFKVILIQSQGYCHFYYYYFYLYIDQDGDYFKIESGHMISDFDILPQKLILEFGSL